jgi:hypothetical protein
VFFRKERPINLLIAKGSPFPFYFSGLSCRIRHAPSGAVNRTANYAHNVNLPHNFCVHTISSVRSHLTLDKLSPGRFSLIRLLLGARTQVIHTIFIE